MRGRIAGFTLLEVMVALSVISIAVMGLMMLIPKTGRMSVVSAEYETARNAASGHMSMLKQEGISGVWDWHKKPFAIPGLKEPEAGVLPGMTIVEEGPDGPDGPVLVTITVSWRIGDTQDPFLFTMQGLVGRDLKAE